MCTPRKSNATTGNDEVVVKWQLNDYSHWIGSIKISRNIIRWCHIVEVQIYFGGGGGVGFHYFLYKNIICAKIYGAIYWLLDKFYNPISSIVRLCLFFKSNIINIGYSLIIGIKKIIDVQDIYNKILIVISKFN